MSRLKFIVFSLFVLLGAGQATAAQQYTVKTGDCLQSIARRHNVSTNEIIKANNLSKTVIRPKQVLIIPEKSTARSEDSAAASVVHYTVKKGDTLYVIAQKAGVPVQQLITLNSINPHKIRIGQKIIIPQSDNLTPSDAGEKEMEKDEYISPQTLETEKPSDERHLLVKTALGFLGVPYKWGGSTVKGIDCSAFVRKIYSLFSVDLPRSAHAQSGAGTSINRDELLEGDLVFFHTRRPLGHVGIYIGNNQFVHASYRSKTIRIDSLDTPYFQKRFQRAVRVKELDNGDI
ncbi:MAG TPA: NlpC/P60 family protein [Smithellaceae bacterium]|nr:NlpC/P60 family protein [Smithellaceae bacterium]